MNLSSTNEEVLKRILRAIKLAIKFHKPAIHFVECTLLTDQRIYLDYLKDQCKNLGIELIEVDLVSKITRNLREEILKYLNELYPDGKPDKLAIAVTGLESSVLIDVNEEYPAVLQILNLGRELYYRDLPYPLIFWLPNYALKKLASVAPDFWSWRSGADKFITTKETVKEAIDEAIGLHEPDNWEEGVRQVTLFERLIEAHNGLEMKNTRRQKTIYRELLYRLGAAYHILEKYQKASRYYEEALKLDELLEDRAKKARELNALGHVHQSMGKFEESKEYYEQYLKLKEEDDDMKGQGIALGNIGLVYYKMDRDKEAIDYLNRAQRINENIRNLKGLADNLGNLGLIYQQLGDMEAAIKHHHEAFSIDREIKNKDGEIKDLGNLGFVYYSQKQFKEAIPYYRGALELSREVKDRRENLIRLAACFRELKEFEEARDYYKEALDTVRKMGDEGTEYEILIYLANIYNELDAKEQVIDYYEKALDLSRKLRDPDKELHCLRKLIQLHHTKWEYEEVGKYKSEACKLLESIGNLRAKKINAWIMDSQGRQTENLALDREYLLCVNIGEPKGYTPLKQSDFIYSLVVEGKDLDNQIRGTGKVSTDDSSPALEKQKLPPVSKKQDDIRTISITDSLSLQETIDVVRRQESKSTEEIQKEETLIVSSTNEKAVEVSVHVECEDLISGDENNKKQLHVSWKDGSELIDFRLKPRKMGNQRIIVKGEVDGIPFDDLIIDVVVMPELTPDQIRQSRDALQNTVDQLNRLLMAKRKELSQEDIDKINEAVGKLLNAADRLTALAIEGTTEQIANSVQGIQNATNNANHALKVLDNIRTGINVVTVLGGLGTAIITGNPAGIIQAVTEVIAAVQRIKMNEETKPKAFLCHSSKDNDLALKLGSDLREQGVDIWVDKWEIKPGDSLRRKIDEGMENADFFFALLTKNSLQSEWIATELDAALVRKISGQCTLVPIPVGLSDEDIPPTLRGLLYVRLDNYEDGVRKLVGLCHDVSERPPLGEVPLWARSVGKLNTIGISSHAEKLAILLNEKSEYGREYDPNLTAQEILEQLDLSEDEIAIAADELESRGWVHLSKTIGMGRVGFHSISPRPTLFIETDPYLRGWDPREDAKSLAAALVNTGKSSVSLREVGPTLGWEPRRINVAVQVLKSADAIGHSNARDSIYVFPAVIVTPRTRRYASKIHPA